MKVTQSHKYIHKTLVHNWSIQLKETPFHKYTTDIWLWNKNTIINWHLCSTVQPVWLQIRPDFLEVCLETIWDQLYEGGGSGGTGVDRTATWAKRLCRVDAPPGGEVMTGCAYREHLSAESKQACKKHVAVSQAAAESRTLIRLNYVQVRLFRVLGLKGPFMVLWTIKDTSVENMLLDLKQNAFQMMGLVSSGTLTPPPNTVFMLLIHVHGNRLSPIRSTMVQ